MSKPTSFRLDDHQERAIEDMVDSETARNQSKAIDKALTAGLRKYGYEPQQNGSTHTSLRWVTKRFAWGLMWIGLAWLALTLLYPIQIRVLAVAPLSASAGLGVLYYVLGEYEPALSNSIRGLFGGESA